MTRLDVLKKVEQVSDDELTDTPSKQILGGHGGQPGREPQVHGRFPPSLSKITVAQMRMV